MVVMGPAETPIGEQAISTKKEKEKKKKKTDNLTHHQQRVLQFYRGPSSPQA